MARQWVDPLGQAQVLEDGTKSYVQVADRAQLQEDQPSTNTVDKTHTTDAGLKAVDEQRTHSSDSYLVNPRDKSHTSDAALWKVQSLTHTTDADLYVPGGATRQWVEPLSRVQFDEVGTETWTAPAAVAQFQEAQPPSGAAQHSITHTTDAYLQALLAHDRTHSTGSFIAGAVSRTHTADAYLWTAAARITGLGPAGVPMPARVIPARAAQVELQHVTDALLLATSSRVHQTNGLIYAARTLLGFTDALLGRTVEKIQTADALLMRVSSPTHGADTLVGAGTAKNQSADAGLYRLDELASASDALLLKLGELQHGSDALAVQVVGQTRLHKSDSMLVQLVHVAHGADAILGTSRSHKTSAFLRRKHPKRINIRLRGRVG